MTTPLSELSAIVEACDGHGSNGWNGSANECARRLARWLCSPGAVEELARATRNAWIMAKVPREGEIVTAETIWTRVGEAVLSTIAQHAMEERT